MLFRSCFLSVLPKSTSSAIIFHRRLFIVIFLFLWSNENTWDSPFTLHTFHSKSIFPFFHFPFFVFLLISSSFFSSFGSHRNTLIFICKLFASISQSFIYIFSRSVRFGFFFLSFRLKWAHSKHRLKLKWTIIERIVECRRRTARRNNFQMNFKFSADFSLRYAPMQQVLNVQ